MMERLPKDLWIQIFIRLPVKTILRCLSVCKSWQRYIQHPSFINSHLQHQRRDLMLVRSIPEDNERPTLAKQAKPECYSLHYDDESFTFYAKHEFPIQHPLRGDYRVVGICNGVVCVTNDEFGISHQTYLWNPTVHKYVELPRPMYTYDEIGPFDHEIGFGFDEKTNDYKVVRIVQKDDYEDPLLVEIYSLSSGVWRNASHLAADLSFQIFERHASGRNHQVFLNGAVHWVVRDRARSRCMVIAFHLGDEVFTCFELLLDIKPDYFGTWMRRLRPIVIQGCLSLIFYNQPMCSIWMMKDYGDSTSWAKHLEANLSAHVDRVIGLRKNGELLIEIRGGLYSYKPTEGKALTYLNEEDLRFRKILQESRIRQESQILQESQVLQESHQEGIIVFNLRFDDYDYDPESLPKELGIRSKRQGDSGYSFYGESYTESWELLGSMNSTEVAYLRAEESDMTQKEDNNVADLVNELQDFGEEGRPC